MYKVSEGANLLSYEIVHHIIKFDLYNQMEQEKKQAPNELEHYFLCSMKMHSV